MDLNYQIYWRVETFSYYPIYPKGKLRLCRVIRSVILANRLDDFDDFRVDGSGQLILNVKKGMEACFREIVRAVLIEIRAAKRLETYGEALKVVKMVRKSLPET